MNFAHVQSLDGVNDGFQFGTVQGAGLGEHQHLFAERHQRGDGGDVGFGGELLLRFRIHLAEHNVAVLFGGSLKGGRKTHTGLAPRSPKINDHNVVALNGGAKRFRGDFYCSHALTVRDEPPVWLWFRSPREH